MSPTSPKRTDDERRIALRHANFVRFARADFKRNIKHRRVDPRPVIQNNYPPPWLANMKIADVLLATPGIGPAKTYRILSRARVSPVKTLAGLTPRQRDAITNELARRA